MTARFALLIAFAALAAACAGPSQTDEAAAGCAVVHQGTAAFSGAAPDGAPDIVETRSFGPTCRDAVFVLTIRAPAADGVGGPVLWTASVAADELFPGLTAAAVDASAEREAVRAGLERWADLALATTAAHPAWVLGAIQPGEPAPPAPDTPLPETGPWRTAHDRDVYMDLRSRALPMACYETGPGAAACIYWEPALGAAAPFVTLQR